MDCCDSKVSSSCCNNYNLKKGGKKFKMEKKTMLWIVIGVLFVGALFLTFQAGATGNVVAAQGAVKTVAAVAQSSSGMVGGC